MVNKCLSVFAVIYLDMIGFHDHLPDPRLFSPLTEKVDTFKKFTWCYKLTTADSYIITVVTEAADSCTVSAGEEVEVAGRVAVHIIQEDCPIALTKAVRKSKAINFSTE